MTKTRDLAAEQFLEMRSRILALAADLDRLDRVSPGARGDTRIVDLLDCVRELLSDEPGRTERIHLRLSDHTTDPL